MLWTLKSRVIGLAISASQSFWATWLRSAKASDSLIVPILYHQTKDILYVKQFLGHRKIEDTLLYVQLAETIFKETTDEFTVRVAKSLDDACGLLEAGFEYVTDMDDVKLFRRRK